MWHFHIFLVWWWFVECLNWRPGWKQKTIFVNEIVWRHECQFWASLAGYRMSCPTWQKEGERDVHFWDFVCTCCFALWCHLMCLYVWFMLRVIFPYIGFSMTYTWYIALLWRFATSVALVKVWFAPKVYLCKALIPFGVKTAECHGAPNL